VVSGAGAAALAFDLLVDLGLPSRNRVDGSETEEAPEAHSGTSTRGF
jgi:hypothetical protein